MFTSPRTKQFRWVTIRCLTCSTVYTQLWAAFSEQKICLPFFRADRQQTNNKPQPQPPDAAGQSILLQLQNQTNTAKSQCCHAESRWWTPLSCPRAKSNKSQKKTITKKIQEEKRLVAPVGRYVIKPKHQIISIVHKKEERNPKWDNRLEPHAKPTGRDTQKVAASPSSSFFFPNKRVLAKSWTNKKKRETSLRNHIQMSGIKPKTRMLLGAR